MLCPFLRHEGGNFAAIFTIASIPLMAGVAAAVDTTFTLKQADQLQNALDTAALAIAAKYYSGMSDNELQTIGYEFFISNMNAGFQDDPEPFKYESGLYDAFGAEVTSKNGEDYVTVRSSVLHQSAFTSLSWRVNRQSVVRIMNGQPACALALNPNADSSVKVQGSSTVNMKGCVIASNSDSPSSVYRGGSAALAAKCVHTVGQTVGLGNISNVSLACGKPMENRYPSSDPLRNLVPPSYTACQPLPGGKTKTLSPGTFCNKTFSGEITLSPGTYILRGGRIHLGGNGSLSGQRVTIFLMEDAQFTVNGNQAVQLSPPESGDYAGVTIYQEADNHNDVTINGTSGSQISGFVYAPGAHVFYAGNSGTSASDKCLRLVGDTLEMTGNSSIELDCEAELGDRKMYAGRNMAIVR